MHLKSLQLHGFKSFADPTTFEFHEGVTAIVGPNGCGKSNVVDGIRWVLGETSAKALRGSEMSDVIFGGTDNEKGRKELGMAEVTLTLADCEEALKTEFNEVSITRRVFRDGKSEYRINNSLCRLRDIHELFMDTGIGRTAYSIMEQGKIDLLLSARPEDRRQVFEEAAGITKFKKEKKEALRKLEYTEANLLRVADVLAEQERRINSLKRQVAKARRYQVLAEDVKVLDTHFSHRRFVEFSAEAEELATSLRALETQRSGLEASLPESESAVVDARDKAQRLEAELSELRQQLSGYQNAMQAAESRIGFNEERCDELAERVTKHRDDIALTEQKLAQQVFDFDASQAELDALALRITEQEQALEHKSSEVAKLAQQREATAARLREAREESKQVETTLASTQAKLESAEHQSAGSLDRLRVLADEEEILKVELAEVLTTDRDLTARISEAQVLTAQLEEAVQTAERAFQHARGDRDAARQRKDELDRAWTVKKSRMDVLNQLLAQGEGLREGTKNVLAGLDDPQLFQPGIRGVIGNHIRVRPGFEPAVEAALGANLEAILVRDAELADAILDRLASQAAGEVALLAPEWVAADGGRQLMTVPEGAECWAADCVEADREIAAVVDQLLEKVLVVPDRATAVSMRDQWREFTYVTRQGEILWPEGVIRGGRASGKASTSLLQRQNEVQELDTEVTGLAAELDEATRQLAAQQERTEGLHEQAEQAKDRLQRHRVELSTLEGQHTLASREAKSLQGKLENVTWERQDISSREESVVRSRATLEETVMAAQARGEELGSELQRLEHHLSEYRRREESGTEERNSLMTSLAVERRAKEAAETQQMPMESRLAELRELNVRRQSEIDEAEERIAAAREEDERLRVEIGENRGKCEGLQAELEEAGGRRSGLQRAINEAEASLSDLRHRISALGEQRSREEVAAAKIDMRLDKLLETVMERYQCDLRAFEPDSHQLLACIAEQRKAQRALERRRATLASKTDGEEGNEHDGGSAEDPPELDPEPATAELPDDDFEDINDVEGLDWEFVETAVVELRRRLDSMGPVNLDAIEEYDELEERHLFVKGQHDDLVNSKVELLNVIERINDETTKLFAETFIQVRDNFRGMFTDLFGAGSKADLILLDDEDPLECGIEVIAKPRGKKLQSISLLSGGERSLTAVALLFSIYMVKPSPFCVLDELDAPLDEANIGRFLQVLDNFIDQSQFIIVTHNKRTMGRADVMYGVTMEEFGISKPVGMRLTSAETAKSASKSAAAKAAARLDS